MTKPTLEQQVRDFFLGNSGAHCDFCIARAVARAPEAVSGVTTVLAIRSEFTRQFGTCTGGDRCAGLGQPLLRVTKPMPPANHIK